ncbi:MAG: metallophosphoesterase [Deltaproteobacteria bacterium]|nr:metallophosphoesterase [Deltaproteobacteria bacterium]
MTLSNKKARLFCWIILILLLFSLIVHIYFRVNYIFHDVSIVLAWVGYTSLGLVIYLFCFAFFRDLLIIVSLMTLKIKKLFIKSGKTPFFSPERRGFLFKASGYSIAFLSASATAFGYATALEEPRIVKIDIRLNQDRKDLRGLRILQITDLHVGPTIQYDYVKRVCDKIQVLKADLILFTGDLADGSPKALGFDVSPLTDIEAPLGKYFVTGNHEYYSGAKRWIHEVKRLGFKPLINEHKVIKYNKGLLTLAGVTDINAGAFFKEHESSPRKAILGCPENSFKLLCAHQPTSIYQASKAGFDFQISGHTHGGQFFPFNFFIRLQQPFIKGYYKYRNTKLYVSQGTGYWGPPLRLGTFPEITLFKFI